MRRSMIMVLALAGALVTQNAAGRNMLPKPDWRFTAANLHRIEQSLDGALADNDCPGLQESAAAVLREVEDYAPDYAFPSTVIPLEALLHNNREKPSTRILAAAALHNLDSPDGNFAVEMAGRYSNQPLVRKICTALAADRSARITRITAPLLKSELGTSTLPPVDARFTVQNLKIIESNLVDGLENSADTALETSSAKTLFEIECFAPAFQFADAIIPLMAILENSNGQVAARLWAARALHELHSVRGDYAVEMMVKFSNQPLVRRLCAGLSNGSRRETPRLYFTRNKTRNSVHGILSGISGPSYGSTRTGTVDPGPTTNINGRG